MGRRSNAGPERISTHADLESSLEQKEKETENRWLEIGEKFWSLLCQHIGARGIGSLVFPSGMGETPRL